MIKLLLSLYVVALLMFITHPAHAANETARVYDRRGRLFASIEGDETSAVVTIDARWRDGALWHTHPYPGLPDLSPDDLYVAFRANLRQMCAVSIEATCCATRNGTTWQPLSRAQTRRITAAIYAAIAGRARPEQIALHHAVIVADAAQRGYDYACY